MICAGIDAGSRTVKAVLMDSENGEIIAQAITDQGIEQDKIARILLARLLKDNHIQKKEVKRIAATGYGRDIVRLKKIADTTVTEITCQAAGVRHFIPKAKTIIDIGGQDSKIIHLDGDGKVRDFVMNDRCAAGSGRFLEVIAERLKVKVASLGKIASKSKRPATISSMCVVFAETEIVGLLATGIPKQDIIAGIQKAIAARISSLAGSNLDSPIVFTGGVALVSGMAQALKSTTGSRIEICPDPQFTCAIGAAIIASEQLNKIL
jgi:predicted CoA-substrate-specific enzyme activase